MMDLTAWINSIIGKKYKLVEQAIEGDGVSNVLLIHQKYTVPGFFRKDVKDFFELHNSPEVIQDGLRIKATVDGWMAADCSLFGVTIHVVPNSGHIVYEDDFMEFTKRGKWESAAGKRSRFCSLCGHDEPYKFADEDADVYRFCPYCGGKMEED